MNRHFCESEDCSGGENGYSNGSSKWYGSGIASGEGAADCSGSSYYYGNGEGFGHGTISCVGFGYGGADGNLDN